MKSWEFVNCIQVKLREFVKIADTVYEVDAAALCDEDRLKYSRMVDFQVQRSYLALRFSNLLII